MIVEMKTGASKAQVDAVVQKAKSLGLEVQLNLGYGGKASVVPSAERTSAEFHS